jgi:hypothetical protein
MARKRQVPQRLLAAASYVLLFAASFILCDRLLFLGLRQAVAGGLASGAVQDFRWTPALGRGDGTALVLGTSRAQYGFDEAVLSRQLGRVVMNEAGPGRYPQFQYHLYRTFKADFARPKIVLYGLDYFMFEKNSTGLGLVRVDRKSVLSELGPDRAVNPGSIPLSRASWLYRTKPKFEELLTVLWNVRPAAGPDGGPADRPDTMSFSKGKPRIGKGVFTRKPARWRKRSYSPFPGREGAFFERLLGELDRDAVPTFLVFIPEYIGTYETNAEQGRFREDIRRLASGFRNVRVLDLDTPQAFDLAERKMFWNGGWGYSNSHLSEPGAARFTALVCRAVRETSEERAKNR